MKKSSKSKTSTTINIGGYHPDPNLATFPMGSIFAVEGQRLYDLVRELKPKIIVEIGGFRGCSTSWLAQGVKDNGFGKVISIDNNEHHGYWSFLPNEYRKYVKCVIADARTCKVPADIDMVFEDGSHQEGFTALMAERFKPKKVWVSHDYNHNSEVGKNVRTDFDQAFGEPDEIFFEPPTDCGLAIKYMT